mmetsp:Transcript_13948/g.26832  ORF Transcript_13948/g.26832 Transcript_13948/m.26832 type:complete len:116 (+) Transcript_13948:82-429(+)
MNGEGERRSLSGLGGGTSEMPRMRTHQTQVGSAPAYEYDPPPPFTNEALNKWEKARKKWTKKPYGYKKQHKRPVLSVDITYEELLMTNKPFVAPVSLQEMVDFLVDCWESEGLFD